MNRFKKIIYISTFLLVMIIGLSMNKSDVYAGVSSFESKIWYVSPDGYVRYGHMIISDTDINVVMVLMDNGETQSYIPIVYSDTLYNNVKLWYGGDHAAGTTLEEAKKLSDYYDGNVSLFGYSEITNDFTGATEYYLYNTNGLISVMEYRTFLSGAIEFETADTPKFYYYEEGADLTSVITLRNAFRYYINGNGYDFEIKNGNIKEIRETYYDLELPLNVKIKNTEWHGDTPKKVKITWEQSADVDVSGWETEVYVQQKGKTGRYIWSVVNQKEFTTPYFFDGTVSNFEGIYNCNILDYEKTTEYIKELRGYSPQISVIEGTNFMLRNKYMEGNILHYSDFVYMKDDGEGNYIGNVVKSEDFDNKYTVDEDGFISDLTDDSQLSEIIDTDNEYYQNENLNNNGFSGEDFSISEVIGNFSGFLGELPGLIADVVSFMPAAFFTMIILGVGVVIALRVLGR